MSLAFVTAVDKHEIDAAKIALAKSSRDDVQKFANFMIKEHSQNLAEAEKLIKAQKISANENNDIVKLKEDLKKERDHLQGLTGHDFEVSYIDTMVKDHEDALKKLNDFIGHVKNTKVDEFLKNTRKHVEMHLNMAKNIQKDLKK